MGMLKAGETAMSEVSGRNEREIGRVTSISNYRVTVLLDLDVRSQVRAYPHHITLVTQIGGYLLFPVAPGESAVGIVVGASEDEAIEPDIDRGMTLQLARAKRTLRINLLGQLLEHEPFVPGVSIYPALETPALLPTEKELKCILEYLPDENEKDRDAPLNLGVSPIYARQPVTASFNDLLARPLGIIGNTGSGKSYSVASIIQEAMTTKESAAKQAKLIILDINGEYSSAFPAASESKEMTFFELNCAYIDKQPFYLPLWTFNLTELVSFFEASQASQVPVLERVIQAVREDALDAEPGRGLRRIIRLADTCTEYLDTLSGYASNPTATYGGQKANQILEHIRSTIETIAEETDTNIRVPECFPECETKITQIGAISDHNIPPEAVSKICAFVDEYKDTLEQICYEATSVGGLQPITADSPVPFDCRELLQDEFFYNTTSRFRGQERIQEFISTMRLRIHRQLMDKRWTVFTKTVGSSLADILGRMTGENEKNVVVLDCSMLAHDVLPFFCAIFGRILLELREHSKPDERTIQPYVLVLEEAHNYLKPRREEESFGLRLAREAFERIAKEGRKFGLSLVIASQRPSDVSATVLSQCANFLVHRIQNPEDIDYFKKILPTGSRDLLDQLPILAPGDGLVLGSAMNVPARVKIRKPNPTPSSETPRPWEAWQQGKAKFDVVAAARVWAPQTDDGLPASELPKKRTKKKSGSHE